MESKYDWIEIQRMYDSGLNCEDIYKQMGVSSGTFASAKRRGDFIPRSRSEALKLSVLKNGPQLHSEETKLKISERRKEYLRNNPDKVPYLLNHKSKGESYPEKFFRKCLEGSDFVAQLTFGTYKLDFAHIEKKIDLEIDGSQHKLDPRIVEHDKRRNLTLTENGWTVFRVYWPEFQKLNEQDRKFIVDSILNFNFFNSNVTSLFEPVENENAIKITFTLPDDTLIKTKSGRLIKKSKINECECGNIKGRGSKLCNPCNLAKRAKNIPPKEELEQIVGTMPMTHIGKKYEVSDNTVRKWCKKYGIEI